MKRNRKSGFSLLEVIAAVVILAVVAAATVATVAPRRATSEDKLADQQMVTLNAMAPTYYLEAGRFPANAAALATAGYIANTTDDERARLTKIRSVISDPDLNAPDARCQLTKVSSNATRIQVVLYRSSPAPAVDLFVDPAAL